MFRRRHVHLVILLLSVLLTCGPVRAAKIPVTHLSYAAHSDSWHEFLRQMKPKFENLHPNYEVNIVIDAQPDQKFAVLVAAGESPEVVDMSTGQAASFIGNGDFVDLRPWFARTNPKALSMYAQPVLNGLTDPSGRLIGYPASVYPIVTFYNLDMLHAAGLTPPAELGSGWTWNALAEYGRKLTRDHNSDGVVDQWGIDRISARPYIQVAQAGGFYYDREMLPTASRLTSEPVLQAIEFLERIVVKDRTSQAPSTPNRANTYIYMGNAAIATVDGPGVIGTLYKDAPFSWDISLQPVGPKSNASAIFLTFFSISRHAKHPEAAWDWVHFISGNDEAQQAFAQITGRVPVLPSVIRRYNTLVDNLPKNWSLFFTQMEQPENITGYGVVADSRITSTVNAALNRIWSGQTPGRVALEQAHREVTALFEEASRR
ncbi:MAG: extracellular solute-binding protein [Limnochordia bacterium]|jgi:multiple sugar transport system substrate-binding protein